MSDKPVLTPDQQEALDLSFFDATKRGDTKKVTALLIAGANVNARTYDEDFTPLYLAVEKGHANIVKELLANGADVNAITKVGLTPLHEAVEKGRADIVKELLANGADVNSKARYGGLTPLHLAAEKGHANIVKELLANGADVSAIDTLKVTPLHLAVENGHADIVKELLANGADVNSKARHEDFTPLHLAVEKGRPDIVKELLANGADVNSKARYGGLTPLHLAVEKDRPDIVKELLANGADVKAATIDGFTPLHKAVENGNMGVIQQLLEKGADVKAATIDGFTPLHFAAKFSHTDPAKLLIAKGADVNPANKGGWTPLHYAAGRGCEEIVYKLLASGCHPSFSVLLPSKDIESSASLAAQNGHKKLGAKLIYQMVERFKIDKDTSKPRTKEQLYQDTQAIKYAFKCLGSSLEKNIGSYLRSLTQTEGGKNVRKGWGYDDTPPKDFQDKLDTFFSEYGIVADAKLDTLFSVPSVGGRGEISMFHNPLRKDSGASSISADGSPPIAHAVPEASKMQRALAESAKPAPAGFGASQAALARLGAKLKDKGAGAGIS